MKTHQLRQLIREEIEKELGDQYKGGLHQAQVGDTLWIGMSGMKGKNRSKVTKVFPDGKVADTEGNIFNPDGRLYRSTNITYQKTTNPDKVISAKLATQTDFDKEFKKIKVDFLRKFKWEDMNIQDLENLISQLPVKQASQLNKSRFK